MSINNLKEQIASGEFIKRVFGARKPMYDGAEVRKLLETAVSISTFIAEPTESSKKIKIKSVRKGDVFIGASTNYKPRPFVVAKVCKDVSYCIPLTSEEDGVYSGISHNSRYLQKGYFSNHMIKVSNDFIIQNFIFPLGNNARLNLAIESILSETCNNFKKFIK